MARYIDAEALKEAFRNNCLHNCYYCKLAKWDKKGACYNCGLIDNAPTVEPFERIGAICNENCGIYRPQGEWILVDDTEKFIAKCSVCGRIEDSRMVKDYPFCHCGAKMKGGAV